MKLRSANVTSDSLTAYCRNECHSSAQVRLVWLETAGASRTHSGFGGELSKDPDAEPLSLRNDRSIRPALILINVLVANTPAPNSEERAP